MNLDWFKTKLSPKIIGLFLIGLILGGFAIGLVDTNRPHPLFSSADGGGGASELEQCSSQADAIREFVDSVNALPRPIEAGQYNEYERQRAELRDSLLTCIDEVRDAFLGEWEQSRSDLQEQIRQAYADAQLAWQYYHATVLDSQAAHDDYNNNCVINPGDYRPGPKDVKATVSSPSTASGEKSVTASRSNDYPDCQELWDAYLAANVEAEQAQQEYTDADNYRIQLEADLEDLNGERNDFWNDYEFTREIAFIQIHSNEVNPNSYSYTGGVGTSSGGNARTTVNGTDSKAY